MKIEFEYKKFTFGGFYSCIYLIPTIFMLFDNKKIQFIVEFRFLNLSYRTSFYKVKSAREIIKEIQEKGDQK